MNYLLLASGHVTMDNLPGGFWLERDWNARRADSRIRLITYMSTRFRNLGRYLTSDGSQRPRLAFLVKPPTAIELAAESGSPSAATESRLEADLREAARHGDLVAVGRAVKDTRDARLSMMAMELRLGVVYVVDDQTSPERLAVLRDYARAGVAGILAYAGGPKLGDPEVARQVESRFSEFASQNAWPLAILASGPLARCGVALRGIARNIDMSGVVLEPDDLDGDVPLPDLSVVARLLAARVEDRPAMLAVEGPADAARAAALALGCGYGVVLAPLSAAAELAPLFAALPENLSDPLLEEAAVFLFDERDGNRVREDAVQGALMLLRRSTGSDVRFCFQDRPDLPPPKLLWVPAHGALSTATWTRLQCMAREGCFIIVSALTLDDDVQARRLESLGVEARLAPPERRARSLATRPVLDCGGHARIQECGDGAFVFVENPLALAPRDPTSIEFVRDIARRAGISVLDSPESIDPGQRVAHYRGGRLEITTRPPTARWVDG